MSFDEFSLSTFLFCCMIQSFNLRRTAPAKPTGNTVPPASVKVNAILEKANAIRQVSTL